MPAHKRNHTTAPASVTTEQSVKAQVQTEHAFHEHLGSVMRRATRIVLEEIIREELGAFLQADWGESTSERRGYRNGSYTLPSRTPDQAAPSMPAAEISSGRA